MVILDDKEMVMIGWSIKAWRLAQVAAIAAALGVAASAGAEPTNPKKHNKADASPKPMKQRLPE